MAGGVSTFLAQAASQPTASPMPDIDPAIATIIAASIAAIIAILTCIVTVNHNRRVIREMREAERRKQLRAALEELLVPLSSQLMQMKGLYDILVVGKPAGFRTLPYLIDPEHYTIDNQPVTVTLSEADRQLLNEIIEIESRVETLLVNKGGLVDDAALHKAYVPSPSITDVDPTKLKNYGLFAIAISHFRVLRLAYRGLLRDDPLRYSQFVYPRELNGAVSVAIDHIKAQLKQLDG